MALGALLVVAALAAPPGFQPVFRIGSIDGSCADLRVVPLDSTVERYATDRVIDPGDWPAVQPGAVDAWAGSHAYTYRFAFTPGVAGPGAPGTYRVRIGFLGAHPYSPPTLRVQIGERIWAEKELQPGKQYIPRDNALQETSPSVLEMDVPAAALPASGPVIVTISQTKPSSWVFYDGIEVLYSEERAAPEISELSIAPAPLVRSADGKQVVRLSARCRGVRAPLELKVNTPSGPVTSEVGAGGSAVLNGEIRAEVLLDPAGESRELTAELASEGTPPAACRFTQRPVRHFELYVVPEAHFDNGYTHPQEECADRAVQNLRTAIDLTSRYDNFSWTSESAYIVQRWWENAPAAERERFLALTRAGRLGFDAAYCNILSGLCTGEELQRLFSYAGSFAAAHQIDLRTATLTDVPSHAWGLPQVLAGSGIEFLSIGGNPTRGGFWRLGEDLFWSPVLWEGPDGSRIFTLIHRHYAHATIVGLTSSLADAEQGVPKWLEAYDRPEYSYDVVHLHGAYWDNALVDARLPQTVRAWNEKYRWPRIRLATNAEFFDRLRAESSGNLPVIRGDGGAYWEDGAASSAAWTAINRDNARRLALAEMFLAAQHAGGKLAEYPAEKIRGAWENVLLYDEHTWGAAWSVTRPDDPGATRQFERKARYAADAQRQTSELVALAARADPALSAPDRSSSSEGVTTSGSVITSPFYRVSLDPRTGLIRSIEEVGSGRELVEAPATPDVPKFGQLIYDTKPRRSPPDSNDIATGSQRSVPDLISVEPVPGGLRSRFRHAMFPKLEMTVVLDGRSPRIDLQYDIEKAATTECEGVYIGFPFALANPVIDYDDAGAIVRAGSDWLPHACLDWFTSESFVRLRSRGFGVAWSSPDAPLFELQGITTHRGLKELPIKNGRIFSYVMNNYWETNYKASQDGPFRFRYAIISGPDLSVEKALSLAWRWSDRVAAGAAAIASAEPSSVRVTAFKQAEDGDGYIARLWNSGDLHGTARLRVGAFDHGIGSAERVSGIEGAWKALAGVEPDDLVLRGGEVELHVHPAEVVTLRVRPARGDR